MQLKTKKKKAFTLVELVIVIAVIGILSAVLVPTFGDVVQSAYLAQDKALVGNINTALAVDQITTGSPNDAVDIQTRLIEDYGLTLETKSEGNYIWYNTATKQVELKKLSEFEGTSTKAAADALVANADGEYALMDAIEAPEIFISNGKDNYLFLSTESKDDFADAIRAMRNGTFKVDDKDALDIIKEIDANVGEKFEAFFATTAVMTNNGVVANGVSLVNCTRIIVAADVETVTATTLANVNSTSAIIVDFHYGVESFGEGGEDALNESSGVIYTYVNENLYTSATIEDVKKNLVPVAERGNTIGAVYLVNVYIKLADGETTYEVQNSSSKLEDALVKNQGEDNTYTISGAALYNATIVAGNATNCYRFGEYSLSSKIAGSTLDIPVEKDGENWKNYTLEGDSQYLIRGDEASVTIYRYLHVEDTTFMYGSAYYSNNTLKNKIGAGNTTTADLTVVSNAAVLDFDLTIGTDTTLMLPYTVNPATDDDGIESSFLNTGKGADNVDEVDASVKLTVNKPLTLASGATLEIGAKIGTSQPYTSYIWDNYAELELNAALESKGNINAYGLITGSGTINATAGTIVNRMRINDYGGGENTADRIMGLQLSNLDTSSISSIISTAYDVMNYPKTFPFEDWEMDSIRVTTKVNGAAYSGWGYMYANDTRLFTDVPLFSKGNNSIFTYDKSATVKYDAGKITAETEGKITDNAIKVRVSNGKDVLGKYKDAVDYVPGMSDYFDGNDIVINLADYYFPLHNMDMTITSGSISLSACKYRIMESSTLTIAAGATATVNNYVIVEGNMIVNGNLTTVGVAVQETESCKHTIVTHDYTHDSKDTFISYLSGKIESTENGEIKVDVTLKNWSKSCSGSPRYNVTVTYGDAVVGPYSCTNVDYYHLEPAGGTNYTHQDRNQTSASLQLLGTVGSVSGSFMPNVTYTYSNGEWTYPQAT